jgi:UDPglucose 6-dehydrogenase
MTKVIIQGQGIVGQSTELFLKQYNPELEIVFNDPPKEIFASDEDWITADWVIVCVDTSLNTDITPPENNTANIDDAINFALSKGFKKNFVIRSTVGIESARSFEAQLGQHVIMWPEYIREASWEADAVAPAFVLVGGTNAEEFSALFDSYTGPVVVTDPVEAMIAKLSTNTFLAMKVIFANQVEQLCRANDASYDVVRQLLEIEPRLGQSHWAVPGPDGTRGFGGKCFPKDVKTFEASLVKNKLFVDLIRGVSDINQELRNENT